MSKIKLFGIIQQLKLIFLKFSFTEIQIKIEIRTAVRLAEAWPPLIHL